MTEEIQNPNWFVRGLLIALIAFLGVLVGFSFFKVVPPYVITPSIVTILALMTLVILSESFNKLSLGKILSLSRDIKRTTEEKEELKVDNIRLRDSLIQVSANIQSQVTKTDQSLNVDLGSLLGTADSEELDKEEDEKKEVEAKLKEPLVSQIDLPRIRRPIGVKILTRYLNYHNLPEEDLVREIQFTKRFGGLDPIMERRVIFDGYLKTLQREYFFLAREYNRLSWMWWDRFYLILSKILLYRQAKAIPTELVLILAKFPTRDEKTKPFRSSEHFLQAFQPAISNGLLRVEIMEFSREEYEELMKEAEQSKTSG